MDLFFWRQLFRRRDLFVARHDSNQIQPFNRSSIFAPLQRFDCAKKGRKFNRPLYRSCTLVHDTERHLKMRPLRKGGLRIRHNESARRRSTRTGGSSNRACRGKVYRGNRGLYRADNIYVLRIQCAVSYQLIGEGEERAGPKAEQRQRECSVAGNLLARGEGPRPSYRCDRIKTERAHQQGETYVDDPAAAGTVDLHR